MVLASIRQQQATLDVRAPAPRHGLFPVIQRALLGQAQA
jgi:hypothetical protein